MKNLVKKIIILYCILSPNFQHKNQNPSIDFIVNIFLKFVIFSLDILMKKEFSENSILYIFKTKPNKQELARWSYLLSVCISLVNKSILF